MNYYEELGLPSSASTEEIRQAYKRLARLLHPDHQEDPHLRKLADLQMMRLNEILNVLTDPAGRERYDETLFAPANEIAPVIKDLTQPRGRVRLQLSAFRLPTEAIVWGAILTVAAVGFTFMFLYFEHDSPVSVYGVTEAAARKAPASGARTGSNEKSKTPPPVATPAVAPGAKAPTPAIPPLIGTWLYGKPDSDEDATKHLTYPPEYIEMVIKPGRDGKLAGTYKAQYRIPDRAISPEVVFQFSGAFGDATSLFPWHASDGSAGEIRLKKISDRSVEASWYTTQFGTVSKLASGTAVLYRTD